MFISACSGALYMSWRLQVHDKQIWNNNFIQLSLFIQPWSFHSMYLNLLEQSSTYLQSQLLKLVKETELWQRSREPHTHSLLSTHTFRHLLQPIVVKTSQNWTNLTVPCFADHSCTVTKITTFFIMFVICYIAMNWLTIVSQWTTDVAMMAGDMGNLTSSCHLQHCLHLVRWAIWPVPVTFTWWGGQSDQFLSPSPVEVGNLTSFCHLHLMRWAIWPVPVTFTWWGGQSDQFLSPTAPPSPGEVGNLTSSCHLQHCLHLVRWAIWPVPVTFSTAFTWWGGQSDQFLSPSAPPSPSFTAALSPLHICSAPDHPRAEALTISHAA